MALPSDAENRTILVFGATGKQGRALIRALLSAPETSSLPGTGSNKDVQNGSADEATAIEWHIWAVTRNRTGETAMELMSEVESCRGTGRVRLVEADLDEPASIRRIFEDAKTAPGGRIWGVFLVLAYPGLGAPPTDLEYNQGKIVGDVSLEHGVQSFVYSSTIPIGPRIEDGVDHSRKQKRRLEQYFLETLGQRGLPSTIVRPGFFMENFEGTFGAIAVPLYRDGLKSETTLTIIASEDIGRIVEGVFKDHDKFRHRILVAAAEVVTVREIMAAHERATGKPMPEAPWVVSWFITKMNSGVQGLLMEADRNHENRMSGAIVGFDEQVALAHSVCKLKTYEEWKRSKKEISDAELPDADAARGWNKLSLAKLFTGRS